MRWAAGLAVVLAIMNWPVTTKQGVNFEVSTHSLPLYVKSFEFLDRDAQYKQLAREVTAGRTTDTERVLAAFDFTHRRIRETPGDWTVVDDHILNIVIRGYGHNDQMADVAAMLMTYSGVPAFWQKFKAAGSDDGAIFTFARVDGRWVVLDVANNFVFRNSGGALATAEEVASQPGSRPSGVTGFMIRSTSYSTILDQLRTPPIPRPLRTELQMPWPRLWYETKRAVGLEHDDGSER